MPRVDEGTKSVASLLVHAAEPRQSLRGLVSKVSGST